MSNAPSRTVFDTIYGHYLAADADALCRDIQRNWSHCTLHNDDDARSLLIELFTHDQLEVREIVASTAIDVKWKADEIYRIVTSVLKSNYNDVCNTATYLCSSLESIPEDVKQLIRMNSFRIDPMYHDMAE